MAAVMIPQTPQRPLPGAFLATPAPSRSNPSSVIPPSNFNSNQMTPLERAGRKINDTLELEAHYPPLDSYVNQGHSADYDIPNSQAWAPFQKIKIYDIPDAIFEQYNQAQVSTMMGLFSDITHAWISIDNALYLWDYTHPNPELLGYEDQPNTITAVKLVTPRPGVFVQSISHLLVVATTAEIILIGLSTQTSDQGAKTISLYQTKMSTSIRGIGVHTVAGSAKMGRVFFAGRSDDHIYELNYQQEEKWFKSQCSKVKHTAEGVQQLVMTIPNYLLQPTKPREYVSQILVDDSRNCLYTLSSSSTIRVFFMRTAYALDLSLKLALPNIMYDLGHKVGQHPLLGSDTTIISISAISTTEAARLNLEATTSTGCRIYFSAVSGSYFGSRDTISPMTSMQVHHVRFPPRDPNQPVQQQPPAPANVPDGQQVGFPQQQAPEVNRSLTRSRISQRFSPGYFFDFIQKPTQNGKDILFISAPDTGRIAHRHDPQQHIKFEEFGLWITLESRAEDIGLITPPFAASNAPFGFGNELAVQFDQKPAEIAVLTNTGVHIFRRRRLVDVFAAAVRYGGGNEGLEGEIRNFVRLYGRGETVATALAVACGQGSDLTADLRITRVVDPEVLECARKTIIDHGGKPMLNENIVIDTQAPAIDNVRPSPRFEGLALYVSRLLRSVWKANVMVEVATPTGGLQVQPTVPISKLQDVQKDLSRLKEFINANKTFIDGLAGPEALGRVSTKQEELALQGEHRALHSLLALIKDVVEGISFVLVLFDERTDEIVLSLQDQSRQLARAMTYEKLFCSTEGKDLAKELVKAIVNRNIAHGSNVDSVTDALRRRCGSFCSENDCIIFKAQEQLNKASDASTNSETARKLLNESLRLLQKETVVAALTMDQLQWAMNGYTSLEFFAGAIELALKVAQEHDKGNRALSWLQEGASAQDSRVSLYESRIKCYDMIKTVVEALDKSLSESQEMIDGHYTLSARRKREAYDVINDAKDETFHIYLYDWYLGQGWTERLLNVQSPYVIRYLERKSQAGIEYADLLWKYHAQYNNYQEAAKVQLGLAKSELFELSLDQRIEYLSRARANASTKTTSLGDINRSRQSRQELIREASDLLDVAIIQDDVLQRIRADGRLTDERRPAITKQLNGRILPVDEVSSDALDYENLS